MKLPAPPCHSHLLVPGPQEGLLQAHSHNSGQERDRVISVRWSFVPDVPGMEQQPLLHRWTGFRRLHKDWARSSTLGSVTARNRSEQARSGDIRVAGLME